MSRMLSTALPAKVDAEVLQLWSRYYASKL